MSHFDEQPDGDPHGECAAEIHRLQDLADAEGSRAVMLVRQRRELIDLGRAVADKLHAAMRSPNEKAVRYLVGEADALAVKFHQHLPNSPEPATPEVKGSSAPSAEPAELTDEQIDIEWMRWNLPNDSGESLAFQRLGEHRRLRMAFEDGLRRGVRLQVAATDVGNPISPGSVDEMLEWIESMTDDAPIRNMARAARAKLYAAATQPAPNAVRMLTREEACDAYAGVPWPNNGASSPDWIERINAVQRKLIEVNGLAAATQGAPRAESWTNLHCQHGICDEEDAHDPKCRDWTTQGAPTPAQPEVTEAMIDAAGLILWPTVWMWSVDPQRSTIRGMLESALAAGIQPTPVQQTRRCLYCERDMIVGSECTSASQAGVCDMVPGRLVASMAALDMTPGAPWWDEYHQLRNAGKVRPVRVRIVREAA